MKKLNIVGQKFNRLLVLELDKIVFTKSGIKLERYICKCDCGTIKSILRTGVTSGKTKSCGCFNRERASRENSTHGKSTHPLYGVWRGIKQRCLDANSQSYPRYGGKGTTVCEEWKDSFQVFYDWAMKSGYRKGLSIDRIDNTGNYEPSNCRWADIYIQANNMSSNKILEVFGDRDTLANLVKKYGKASYSVINYRLERGWEIERAFTQPPGKFIGPRQKEIHTYKGEKLTFLELVDKYSKVPYSVAYHRFFSLGWSLERTLSEPNMRIN